MTDILIFSQDLDIGTLISMIAKDAGYTSTHVQSMEEVFQTNIIFNLLIIDSAYNLNSNDWEKLKKFKASKAEYLPIIINSTPSKDFLYGKIEEGTIDIVLPYPCGPQEITDAISSYLK